MKSVLCIICFFFVFGSSYAQQENIWAFGRHAGVDFSKGEPFPITTALDEGGFLESCASVSDEKGQLQFYTGGSKVWDGRHMLMPNGNNLTGITSSSQPTGSTSQGSLIIPVPDSSGKYYIFSLSDYKSRGKLFYSVIDMHLNGGYGDIRTGEKGKLLDSAFTEKMTAVIGDQCNIWLVLPTLTGNINAYDISANGVINPVPVVSTGVGLGSALALEPTGGIAFSPNRRKLAATKMGTSGITCALYDFDPGTGIVSNPIPLIVNIPCFSVCFSPDNSKLYVVSTNPAVIHQFDLSSGDSLTITGSQKRVGAVPFTTQLKRGPDDKIYFFQVGAEGALGRINKPDAADTACQYTTDVVKLLAGTTKGFGFPNTVPVLKRDSVFTGYTIKDCEHDLTLLKADSIPGAEYLWNDGLTGKERQVTEDGIWWVQYKNAPCITYIDTFYVYKTHLDPVISVNGFELSTADIYSSYQWFLNGEEIGGATGPVYQITENGNYCVVVQDSSTGCSDTSGVYPVTNVTGIKPAGSFGEIHIYPNPAENIVYIETPVLVRYKLFDLEGRLLSHQTSVSQIEVSALPKGIYLLQLEGLNGSLLKKN